MVVGEEPLAFDILLAGTSGLSGTVRTSRGHGSRPGAMVVVTDVRGDVLATGVSGDAGEFTFGELIPGFGDRRRHGRGLPSAGPAGGGRRPGCHPGRGGPAVRCAGAGCRQGRRSPAAPLNDARVTLIDAAGNVVASSTTGEDGVYAFTDLDAGEYSVIATGYPPVAGSLTVSGTGVDGHDTSSSPTRASLDKAKHGRARGWLVPRAYRPLPLQKTGRGARRAETSVPADPRPSVRRAQGRDGCTPPSGADIPQLLASLKQGTP